MTMQDVHVPSSTYRLQFHAGFTFRDATAILDYLDDLGVGAIYASPLFQAGPESRHGYDVANHNAFNPALGSAEDFRSFVSELRRRHMGLILDFVPNHMGIGEALNLWWMDVLENGPSSAYAEYFDIDWHPGKAALEEKVLLPILGKRYGEALEAGEFRLCWHEGAFFLHYFETKLPMAFPSYTGILQRALSRLDEEEGASVRKILADRNGRDPREVKARLAECIGNSTSLVEAVRLACRELEGEVGVPSSFDALHELLEAQAYRLCFWRVAAEEINYRRFFDINSLAAIRVEIPEVFEAAHRLVFELLARGEATGLRIDHVDGLWNPRQYLERLQDRYATLTGSVEPGGLYLVVEKILDAAGEPLPADWPVHGTTGYEFANQVVQLLADGRSENQLSTIYQRFVHDTRSFADVVYEKKLLVMEVSFASELAGLGRELDQLSEIHRRYRDFTLSRLTQAVREVLACFPVYRTYVAENEPVRPADERVVLRAVSLARRRNPSVDKPVFDFLRNVLLMRLPEELSEEQRRRHSHFVMRFQQCSGPIMAKGLEDTALYCFHRLAAFNEVGGNPGAKVLGVADFHRLNDERAKRFPHSMLTTSTHDTKRSEDVRMRMVVLSELPDVWRKALRQWRRMNGKMKVSLEEDRAPSDHEEYLLYQILLGTWPLTGATDEERQGYQLRIRQYFQKVLKEGKVNSSWTEPNEEWEQAVSDFIGHLLQGKKSRAFRAAFASVAERIALLGAWNSLVETVLKCTVPGVPDVYQGTEIWDFSLVDPDNRRPVDYKLRRRLADLPEKPWQTLLTHWQDGRIKLVVLRALLRFRRSHAEFFREADYQTLNVGGNNADQALAFLRTHPEGCLLVVVGRHFSRLDGEPWGASWGDTHLISRQLDGDWQDVLCGRRLSLTVENPFLAEVLAVAPFAVLYRSSSRGNFEEDSSSA